MARFKGSSPLTTMALVTGFSSVVLIGWIIYLIFDLPTSYHAQNWDLAWVGFDIGMVSCLLMTSWAMWKQRQISIPGAMVSSTFLIIDSWFDVITSQGGEDFTVALASAFLVQLPAAYLLFRFSRKAIKRSLLNAHRHAGIEITSISLFKTPLTIFKD